MSRGPANGPAEEGLPPVRALAMLFGDGHGEVAERIFGGIGQRIFEGREPEPSGFVRRLLARFVLRLMRRTTREDVRSGQDGRSATVYRNRILEKSGHPYTATLLQPTSGDNAFLVTGGDPMNAIYMMLCPEVRSSARMWDFFLLDSVQSRDVQIRFARETRVTHDLASGLLRQGRAVRIKAFASGIGLSVLLVCDRLLRDGHDPRLLRAVIADRDPDHALKTVSLIEKLPRLRAHLDRTGDSPHGIAVQTEDIFQSLPPVRKSRPFDVVTAIGIFEYFTGFTCRTSVGRLSGKDPEAKPDATDLARILAAQMAPGGCLVVNSSRDAPAAQILEVFGKRFHYRSPKNMRQLAATAGLTPQGTPLAGNIYDVMVFKKPDPAAGGQGSATFDF
jgi:hypothetical protein